MPLANVVCPPLREIVTLNLTPPPLDMASCDDDFGLLGDESHPQLHHHHSHHQHHHHHHQTVQQQQQKIPFSQRYISAAAASASSSKGGGGGLAIHSCPLPPLSTITSSPRSSKGGGVDEVYTEAFAQAGVNHCFTTTTAEDGPGFVPQSQAEDEEEAVDDDEDGDPRSCGDADAAGHSHPTPPPLLPSRHHHPQQQLSDPKRKDRDEASDDGESPCSIYFDNNNKKSRSTIGPSCSSSGDYRKDREEWSDSAIACLLDAYTDKYIQLNRGNLRGRDWEDVAAIVSEQSDKHKSGKSVEQCKNKVDNLKKRYKVECQRLSSGSLAVSHWPWFKKMEQIVGSSPSSSKAVALEDDKPSPLGSGAASLCRQQLKRYTAAGSSACLGNNLRMKSVSNPRWKRAVLKITGSALSGTGPQNVDPKVILLIAREVAIASRVGVEVAIVVGGRNFFCGDTWVAATDTDRATAYQIGMMASAMNCLLLQASLEKIGIETRVQTAFMVQEIAEPYIRRRAIRHLEKGRIVIFSGIGAGMGNPLLRTDTAAALRASEINADVLLKGTNMDHGYDCHSRTNSAAFEHISFKDLDSRCLSSVDMTAITFCAENNIPVVLFNLFEPGNISRALCGEQVGTLIDQAGRIS